LNQEKLDRHIQHLQEQHDDLDKQIYDQYKKYGDDVLVQYMKKQKLKIKDEITHLKKQH